MPLVLYLGMGMGMGMECEWIYESQYASYKTLTGRLIGVISRHQGNVLEVTSDYNVQILLLH